MVASVDRNSVEWIQTQGEVRGATRVHREHAFAQGCTRVSELELKDGVLNN